MEKLRPIELHKLIGRACEWTDELWDEALDYVLDNTATPAEARMMAVTILGKRIRSYPHKRYKEKIDFLCEFRDYPPTMFLGAFDLLRQHNAREARLKEIYKRCQVEQRDLSYYRIPVDGPSAQA